MKGAELIIHTASPLHRNIKHAIDDMIGPAVKGAIEIIVNYFLSFMEGLNLLVLT